MGLIVRWLLLLLLMVAPCVLMAQEGPEPIPSPIASPESAPENAPEKPPSKLELPEWRSKAETNVASSGAKVVQGLGVCLASLFILLHVYKKLTGATTQAQRGRLKVIERVPLVGKNVLVLVEVDGKAIAFAVGPDQVTVVHEQSEGMFAENLVLPPEKGDEPTV